MGYMHTMHDPIATVFFAHVSATKGRFVDMGAAYGCYTLQALQLGAKEVLAVDLEKQHLEHLQISCSEALKSRLMTATKKFPDELTLPTDYYDGAILSRVLLFLNGPQIARGLSKIYAALKPGVKIFIITAAPFRKKWQALYIEYEKQKQAQSPWPGYITEV